MTNANTKPKARRMKTAPKSNTELVEKVSAGPVSESVPGRDSEKLQEATGQEIEPDNIESMAPDSLAARWLLERRSVLRELHRAMITHILFFTRPEGGGLTMEEAIKKATERMEGPEAEDYYKNLSTMSAGSISWLSIDQLFRYHPESAQMIWEDLKEQADLDFKSGHFVAELFEGTDWQRDPWKRARFIAVRESFVEQFDPQGGIDYSMIDMLAATFAMWMHWTQEHMYRSTTRSIIQPTKTEREYAEKYQGEWIPPRVSEKEAIDHAAQLADRWRRAYQSTLRQMRDWRRYNAPVTINNPGQVNIAAEGGQQINAMKVEEK